MKFAQLARYFEDLEQTPSRLKMTEILARLFKEASSDEIGEICYLCLGRLVPLYESLEFQLADKMVMRAIGEAVGKDKEPVLKLYKKVGDLGIVAKQLKVQNAKFKITKLTVMEVYKQLKIIAQDKGQGSQERKVHGLAQLFGGVDAVGAKYVARMVVGRLRLGFSVMTMIDAFSWMKVGDKSLRGELEQAYYVRADIGELALEFKKTGVSGLKHFSVKLGVPIMPALCQRLKTADEMIAKMGKVVVQPKFDGTRVQIHFEKTQKLKNSKTQEDHSFLRTFTRNLEETTQMFPELLSADAEINAESVILDSEAIGVNPKTGKLMSFQETIVRKRKYMIAEASLRVPLKFFVFDVLYLNGTSLIDKPLHERRKILQEILRPTKIFVLTEEIVTEDANELRKYHHEKLSEGLEGAVVKKFDGEYVPGRRGWNWVKFKEEETASGKLADTLDCVVMGYYFGKGKRTGFGLGAFLVGVRGGNGKFDEEKFYTIAKIGTGLSDVQWRELKLKIDNARLPDGQGKLITRKQPEEYQVDKSLFPDVWVAPKIVVEIAADNLTISPNHSAGLALRFPRLVRFRDDKSPQQATSVTEVEQMAR